ncbi:hypothetical protein [Streptomyces sp. NBC_00154]|uniref:hypothetical protein n=1 Tax=Streptomyces sp. NBC_00154 TaxID=2975670 RepID=UPI0022537D48|nr:hypothetical protein [Streptomyces sp. NBC_00154]MCX5316252.1 hypothetical protein [Streptomyces sp. NBC_00154]
MTDAQRTLRRASGTGARVIRVLKMIVDVMTGCGLYRPRQVSEPIPGCAEAGLAGMIAPLAGRPHSASTG